jgi:hypothetical protein
MHLPISCLFLTLQVVNIYSRVYVLSVCQFMFAFNNLQIKVYIQAHKMYVGLHNRLEISHVVGLCFMYSALHVIQWVNC